MLFISKELRVRMTDLLYNQLKKVAHSKGYTISTIVRSLIRMYLKKVESVKK